MMRRALPLGRIRHAAPWRTNTGTPPIKQPESQIRLSWNAHPPTGATASAPVSTLMPFPSSNAWLGQMLSTDHHAALHAVEQLDVDGQIAAVVARRTPVAVADPERHRVLGMQHHARAALAADRGRGLGERRVEIVPRRRRHQAERHLLGRLLDDLPVVGELRHRREQIVADEPARGQCRPVGREPEPAVGMGEAADVVRVVELRLTVEPAFFLQPDRPPPSRCAQGVIDELARGHPEPGMVGPQPLRERADHLVVRTAFVRRPPRSSGRG